VVGNYCTWNPLIYRYAYANKAELTNGNLDALFDATAHGQFAYGTISVSTGKWYFEYLINNTGGGGAGVGVANYDHANNLYSLERNYQYSGNKSNGTSTPYGASYTSGSVIGVALDMDTGSLTFYKNGVSQGVAFTDLLTLGSVSIFGSGDNSSNFTINAGQRPFAYTAPSGFKALCTTNLPEPTIADGSTAMDVALYTGNGSTQTISGLNFSPDFVWIKPRSVATQHNLYDAVRGATKALFSDFTDAEATVSNGLTAFNSDGFSLGSNQYVNDNAVTFVAWTWDAGSSTVTNTEGSITSQVRANASAGFSVVTYTGAGSTSSTIGHGLGVAPSFIIAKARTTASQVNSWRCYHRSLGATQYLTLNATDAAGTFTDWANTSPTSTLFYVGGTNTTFPVNESGINYVAYCFAPVAGYSSFGSYTGNGSTDGPFVYTGFRPRWILYKRTDDTGYWLLVDALRNGFNPDNNTLCPNLSDAEDPTDVLDILSNGFKLRVTGSSSNASGGTYIFAAFAENPFQYARAR
jgi:hypothetical protein